MQYFKVNYSKSHLVSKQIQTWAQFYLRDTTRGTRTGEQAELGLLGGQGFA